MKDRSSTLPDRQASTEAEGRRRNVEAILPLSPNQRALLLYGEMEGDDPGFLQVRFTLDGPLDIDRFERAWAEVLTWHQALRTSIHARAESDPMAVVWRRVQIPLTFEDWKHISANRQADRMASLLENDRASALDLRHPPPMRAIIVQTEGERHEVVWTCHHLFIDGWSAAIVLEDLVKIYRALGTGHPALEPPPPNGLRDYAAWVAGRDHKPDEQYWQKRLDGFVGTPPLSLGSASERKAGHDEVIVTLEASSADRISKVSSDLHVTVNSFVQAAWALVVSRLFGNRDVVFGTTVAGRSAEVDGMERLVGYFSNAVPIRITVAEDQSLAEWLRTVRDDQFAMQPFEHASLGDIQAWSSIPGHRQLFETFLVVENFPAEPSPGGPSNDLSLSGFRSGLTTAFPLTVAFALGEPWFVQCRFDTSRTTAPAARQLAGELIATLEAMAAGIDGRVGDIRPLERDRLAALFIHEERGTHSRPATTGDGYRAPQSPTEARLATMWQELLDLPRVGIDDDYFALGGTSIGAVRMFARIEEELGAALPLRTLIQHPTVAGLAGVVGGEDGEEPGGGQRGDLECLVPIQTDGDKIPLACVHGGDGEVLRFRALAGHLGTDQPVYGLEPVGLDGRSAPLDSVPAMASRYIEELRTVQPVGPYRLVGYCFGGSVCLEMANQLEAAGETVDLLAVVDGGLPLEAARASSTLARARAVLKTRGVRGAFKAALARLRDRGQVAWDGSVSATARRKRTYLQVTAGCREAFRTFQPKAASAPITLIRSDRDHAGLGKDWHIGWEAYTPHFEAVPIDADHFSLFDETAVDQVAEAIRSRLADSG